MTEEQFLLAIRSAFATYGHELSNFLKFGSRGKLTFGELKLVLLGSFMEMIEYYFRTTTSGDENWCTAEEIEDVISHANRIMKTEYYVDLS